MPERIGIVTGGGDCPGLNAVIRAVVKAAAHRGWESLGFLGGYEGMLAPLSYRPLDYTQMGGLLFRGGTILGTSNKGRFAAKTGHGEVRRVPEEILGEAKRNFDALGRRRRAPVDCAGRCLRHDAIFLRHDPAGALRGDRPDYHRDRHVDAHPA